VLHSNFGCCRGTRNKSATYKISGALERRAVAIRELVENKAWRLKGKTAASPGSAERVGLSSVLGLFSLKANYFLDYRTELIGDGLVPFKTQQPLSRVIREWFFVLEHCSPQGACFRPEALNLAISSAALLALLGHSFVPPYKGLP